MEEKERALEIYFDGTCPLCNAFIRRVQKSKLGELVAHDVTANPLPPDVPYGAAMSEIHVRGADGRMHKNADAILEVLSSYPLLQPLVWAGRLPLVRQLLRLLYNNIARNRLEISRILGLSKNEHTTN